MKREEYLSKLRLTLQGEEFAQVEEAIAYFDELLQDRMADENLDEEAAVATMDEPEKAAAMLHEYSPPREQSGQGGQSGQSGQSQVALCKTAGVSVQSMLNWRRRLQVRELDAHSAMVDSSAFVEIASEMRRSRWLAGPGFGLLVLVR